MKAKDLVGKVNSFYQTSKEFVKNPRSYIVAPLALAASVGMASKAYSGTFHDPIRDGILNSEGGYVNTPGIYPQDEIAETESTPGEIKFIKTTTEYDELTLPSANGAQNFMTRWKAVKPSPWLKYGIILEENSQNNTFVRINVITKPSGETKIESDHYVNSSKIDSDSLIFIANEEIMLRLNKKQNNSIECWAKQDNGIETFIGVYENCENLIIPRVRGPPNDVDQYSLLEVKDTGPEVLDVYNDALPPPVPLKGLTQAILATILLGTTIKKRKK